MKARREHVYMYVDAHKGQERAQTPLEQELQAIMLPRVGAGSQTLAFLMAELSLQPLIRELFLKK